jgi:flagellar biogenesis protein FliO
MQGITEESVEWPQSPFWRSFWSALKGLIGKVRIQKRLRALRIEETLPLGEKRFLALVRWNDEALLVGVTPQNITLLQPNSNNRLQEPVA